MNGRLIIPLLVLFSLLQAAQGFTAVFPQQQFAACDCEPVTGSFTITNTAAQAQLFRIEAAGPASAWLRLPGAQFRLAAGQAAEIPFQIQSPCAIQGDYGLELVVRTPTEAKRYPLDIAISRCPNIAVAMEKSSAAICSGDTAVFSAAITNTRSFPESYTLSLTDFQDTATASFTSATIAPNKSAPLEIRIPLSRQPGAYNLSLITKAAYSRLTATTPLTITVLPCDALRIALPENLSLCEDTAQDILVPVTNTGARPVTASLSLSAPPWVAMQPDALSISPGMSSALTLSIHARQSGRHTIEVAAQGKDTSAASAALTVIPREDCALAEVALTENTVTITNAGLFPGNYSLHTAPDIGIAREFSLGPGQSLAIPLPQEERRTVSLLLDEGGRRVTRRITVGQPLSFTGISDALKGLGQPIAGFFSAYWLMLLIGVAALAVLIGLIKLATRLKSRRLEKELLANERPRKEEKPEEKPVQKPKKAAVQKAPAKHAAPKRRLKLPLVHPAITITLIAFVVLALLYLLFPDAASFVGEQWKAIAAAVAALLVILLVLFLLRKYRHALRYGITALVILLAAAFVAITFRSQLRSFFTAAWRLLQDFLALYGSYIIIGVVLLLVIIFFLRLGKGETEEAQEEQPAKQQAAGQVKRAKRK